jgi:hypothetical protein
MGFDSTYIEDLGKEFWRNGMLEEKALDRKKKIKVDLEEMV